MSNRPESPLARAKKALLTAAASSQLLYRVCRQIVYRHDGDNDCDMFTNGEHALMRHALPGARVVFDVGANVGDWLKVACSINPAADYHAFEPSPSTYRALAAHNFPQGVHLVNAGLGSSEGESELFIYGSESGTNSVYQRRGTALEAKTREPIKIFTLDGYCERNGVDSIDFLKIDVEGHELAVLQGARNSLARGRVKLVTFEYGGTFIDSRSLLADIWELMQSVNPGYDFFKLFHDGPRLVPAYKQEYETFRYSNWVMMLSDHELARAARR